MNTYKINDNSWENLKNLNFRSVGDGIYIHNFPLYKWNGFVTITGRFTAYDDSNNINVDVYQEDGRPYAPYYNNNENDVMSIIKANIKKECRRCNISFERRNHEKGKTNS